MHHQYGILVYLEHEGEQYAEHDVPEDESVWTSEYPENDWLQGRCNTLISQVAVCRRLDESEDESVVICLVLTPDFSLFSADAVHVRIRVGQEHGVFSHATVVSKHAITKETTAKFTFPSPNRMPPARKDDTKSSVKWKTTRKADQGSIAVFVTRGRCKIGQQEISKTVQADLAPAFKPLRRPNGETYCFEFQCRPKGYEISGGIHEKVSSRQKESDDPAKSILNIHDADALNILADKEKELRLPRILSAGHKDITEGRIETAIGTSHSAHDDDEKRTPTSVSNEAGAFHAEQRSERVPSAGRSSPLRTPGDDEYDVPPQAPEIEADEDVQMIPTAGIKIDDKKRAVDIDLTLEDDDEVIQVKEETKHSVSELVRTGPEQKLMAFEEDDVSDLEDELREVRLRRKLRALKKRKMAVAKTER